MVLPPALTPHTGTRHYRRLRVSAPSGRSGRSPRRSSPRPLPSPSPYPSHTHHHARRPATRARPSAGSPRDADPFLNETPIPPHPVALAQPFLTCSAVCRYHQRDWNRLVVPLACPTSPSSWWSRLAHSRTDCTDLMKKNSDHIPFGDLHNTTNGVKMNSSLPQAALR
ncbi:hypothetical protein PVAP13_3KG324600 [Panicum virgatum]|uniref:Uncharacterized protein n=1 Tax=Panicum virgatum TaxID=38727 RepID=A0A8T0UNY9_PANVG|nr:hypothetical protein PVAP13_3KG324600 [Panicum virgatum]